MTNDPISEFPQDEFAREEFEQGDSQREDFGPNCPPPEDFDTGNPPEEFQADCAPPEHFQTTSDFETVDTSPNNVLAPEVGRTAKLAGREKAQCPDREKHDAILKRQFVSLPMAIMPDLRTRALSYRDVCLYCYLLAKQGNKYHLWWSVEALASLTGIPQTGVKESLRKLVASGHIRRKRTKKSSDTQCLTRIIPEKEGGGFIIKGETVRTEKTPGGGEERR